jgi:hypothetical protein
LVQGLLEEVGLGAAREEQIVEAIPDHDRDNEPERDGESLAPSERGHDP